MTTAIDLERVTTPFADDIDLIADISGYASTTFNVIRQITTTPRIVAGSLDGIADPLTLPNTVIDPLKLFPYGIGAAIKKFDQITDRTTDQIRAQADKAWNIDERLTPFNSYFEPFETWFGRANTVINGPAETVTGAIQIELGLDFIVQQQKEEAKRLVEEIGGIDLEGTKLGRLIEGRVAMLADWDPGEVQEMNTAIRAVGASANNVRSALPDLSGLTRAEDIIQAAFSPVANAANYLGGVLDKDYTVIPAVNIPAVVTPGFYLPAIWPFDPVWVPPVTVTPAINTPALVVNPANIITTISDAIQVVQDFVEKLVLDALDAIGINLFGAIDALEAKLLSPISPTFDAISALETAFDAVAASLSNLLDKFLEGYGNMVQFLENVQGQASLFDWTTLGSNAADALDVVDERIDAIFGLEGDDMMRGGVGDFLFGGAGDDTLRGGASDLFGGDGDDLMQTFSDSIIGMYMNGGEGKDTMIGGGAWDTLHGGAGSDYIVGQGGDDRIIGGDADEDLRDDIFGGLGNDWIDGGAGNDMLRGDDGHDKVTGGKGADTIIGGEGSDTLTGSSYSDLIFGGDGFDFINGGFGNDRLNGGADADRFFHAGSAGHGSDWVQDYNAFHRDILVYGGGPATADDFQVNFGRTNGAGRDDVDEAFIIHKPSGLLLWALVDGGNEPSIFVRAGSETFDIL